MEELISISDSITISPIRISLDLLLIFIISRITVWHYEKYSLSSAFSNTKNAFSIVAMSTVLIISVVKSSLALSLGLVGALSIIRFRTPIKDPEELGYLFFIIATALAAGAEQEIALIVSAPIILFFLYLINLNKQSKKERGLLCLEVEEKLLDSVIETFQKGGYQFSLNRLIKENNKFSLDVNVGNIDFTDLNKLIKEIEGKGVELLTFISNEE